MVIREGYGGGRTAVLTREVLGRGRTAEVFAWGDNWVLKLFYPGEGVERAAAQEYQNSRWAFQCGLPVPMVEGLVSISGRPGKSDMV